MRQYSKHLVLVVLAFLFIPGCATMRWKAAQYDDTIEAYREFLRHHPHGKLSHEARARLDSLCLQEQEAQAAILSETPIAEFDSDSVVEGTFRASPDSRRIAYLAKEGQKRFAVVDGKREKRYDDVSNLIFSLDGRRVAYVAKEGKKQFVVVDSKEEQRYDAVGEVVFSPDSRRIAYLAKQGQKRFVVLDGKQQEGHTIVFSPDSRRIAYIAEKGEKELVILDSKEGKKYDAIGDLVFSPDSRRVAYVAREDRKQFVVVDGKEEQQRYDAVGNVIFSPDSRRVAYVAFAGGRFAVLRTNPPSSGIAVIKRTAEAGKAVVVVDGKEEGRRYDDVDNVIFSPDSRRVAYVAREGQKWIIIMGPSDMVHNVILLSEKESVVVDGKDGKRYSGINSLVFSQNSKQIAYVARKGKRRFVVVGNKQGKRYDDILRKTISLDTPDEIQYLAIRNNTVYLVKARTE